MNHVATTTKHPNTPPGLRRGLVPITCLPRLLACLKTATTAIRYAPGVAALLICLYGCNPAPGNGTPNVQASDTAAYFNLNRFFNQEITRLQNSKTGLQKTAALNQESETKTLKEVNWQKELSAFTASDINKPAWKGKYTADTTRQNGFTTVTYTATDHALRTRLVQLNFKNGSNSPVSVAITNQTNNFVYQTNENLHYQTTAGYNIKASQKVILMQPETFAITAGFVNQPQPVGTH
ncbi:hypothetical protein C7N43_10570 [Sphingobacteriales bacterium UPWRP_1]|nr:hypothetical protein BVG80_13910 [Sphingobacteriales bacterium TSM_CSM]PSJ77076.1 hypothetical protein C7N43_10570 [Sphingobacteriales bacterium UPWRP_1]